MKAHILRMNEEYWDRLNGPDLKSLFAGAESRILVIGNSRAWRLFLRWSRPNSWNTSSKHTIRGAKRCPLLAESGRRSK